MRYAAQTQTTFREIVETILNDTHTEWKKDRESEQNRTIQIYSERVNYVRAIILLYLTNYQATSTHTPNMDDSMQFYPKKKKK